MGLRIKEGIQKENFYHLCGLNFDQTVNRQALDNLKSLGLLTETEQTVQATTDGLLVLNKMIEDLCC